MSLQQLIERYVRYRQALGERFKTNASVLRAFGRTIGPRADIGDIRAGQISAFLAGAGPVTSAWHSRHNALKGFYRYAIGRGYVAAAPLPAVLPKRPPLRPVHLLPRGAALPAERHRLLPAPPQQYGAPHGAHPAAGAVRRRPARPRG